MKTNGLILAAGLSRRMGIYKPLADLCGEPLIARTIGSMIAGGVSKIVVVTGHNREMLEDVLQKRYGDRIRTVFNPDYADCEMFDSFRLGLRKLPPEGAFYLLPADMPAVSPDTFRILRETMEESGKAAVFPVVDGKRKHPPLLSMDLMPFFLHYSGGGGLKNCWQYLENEIADVKVSDAGCLLDADTPGELEALREYVGGH